jgi:alkylation response protein AidB-like acyl-CoA dehydrogenase
MDLGISNNVAPLLEAVKRFMEEEILPLEHEYLAEINVGDRWALTDRQVEIMGGLKEKARAKGLWNFFLTDGEAGSGLNTVEYAYLAEEMGKSHIAAEVFNCSAPDTGNMRRHQYLYRGGAGRRRVGDQRREALCLRRRRSPLQGDDRDGEDRTGRPQTPAAVPDPGADRRAGV